jgi:hypothetical protein
VTGAPPHRPESTSSAPVLRWSWQRRDRHRWVTGLGTAGLAAAGGMALFGLPPVDLHGLLHHVGVMDPLCGGTRAAAYAARGDWATAWRYNPLGIIAVLGAAAALLRAVLGLTTGRWLTATVTLSPAGGRVLAVVTVILFTALTVRQQLRADLLLAEGVL